jgi:hypothetical protein
MTLTADQLESALVMLKRQGVKSYTDTPGGGFAVEFFADEPPTMPGESKKLADEADLCACGHPEFAHMNGYCTELGCTPDRCNPEKKP